MNAFDCAISSLPRGIWAPERDSAARGGPRRIGVCRAERACSRFSATGREAERVGHRVRLRGIGVRWIEGQRREWPASCRVSAVLGSEGAAGGACGALRAGRGRGGCLQGCGWVIGGEASVWSAGLWAESRRRGVGQRGRVSVIGGGARAELVARGGWDGAGQPGSRDRRRGGGGSGRALGLGGWAPGARSAGRVTRGFSAMRWGFNRLCVSARGAGAVGGIGAEHGGPCAQMLRPNSALERTAAAACAALLRCVSRPPRPLNSHVIPERTRR